MVYTLSNANSGARGRSASRLSGSYYGVMVDQDAYSGSVVTSGTFTKEAKQFAEGKRMELIDGERL